MADKKQEKYLTNEEVKELAIEYAKQKMFNHISENGDKDTSEVVSAFFDALDNFQEKLAPEFKKQNKERVPKGSTWVR